jgi:hypothetical protein
LASSSQLSVLPYYIGLTLDGPAAKERKEIEMTGRQVQIARRLLGWTREKASLKRPASNSRTTIHRDVRLWKAK